MTIDDVTLKFIREHRKEDVRQLALRQAGVADVNMPVALQQIAGWQTARRKLPAWAAVEGIIYPPHINMEQCSSEQTALYKAKIAGKGRLFVDLTGGFGVDFHAISSGFERSVYVERNEQLCAISSRNFQLLGSKATVVCDQAETYLQQMEHADLIYLDPARRDEHGARTYSIEDCTPNVLELLPMLLAKADRIMLKLSPMLDWHKAVSQLRGVSEVHVVSVQNECKELLLMVSGEEEAEAPQHTEPKETKEERVRLICVNLLADGSEQVFSPITHHLARPKDACYQRDARTPTTHHPSPTQEYLYEPNSSIMKAGCFDEIAVFYHITELSANSHLFVSDHEVVGFPGRKFRIESVSSLNKRELRNTLANVERANITVRNFPMSAETLRKRLRIKDGGDVYIFATTTADGEHQLFICRKIA